MFENVQFFRICILSLQKFYYDKKMFVKNINMGLKKRRILCKFVDAGFKKTTKNVNKWKNSKFA